MKKKKLDRSTLPKWPNLDLSEAANECRVYGKHITYPRLSLAESITMLLGLAFSGWVIYAFFFSDYEIIRSRSFDDLIIPFIGTCLGGVVVFKGIPIAKIICRLFFPRKTSVRFTTDTIFIGWKRFDILPTSDIQFRASRPHLSDEKYSTIERRRHTTEAFSNDSYKLKFRKIEMIYGSRLIHITSISDQDKAEQFAMMLQHAYRQPRLGIAEEKPAVSQLHENEEFGEMLPE